MPEDTMKWSDALIMDLPKEEQIISRLGYDPDIFKITVEFSSDEGTYLYITIECYKDREGKHVTISIPVIYRDGFMHYRSSNMNRYNAKELIGESIEYIHDFFSKVININFNIEKACPSTRNVPDEYHEFRSEAAKFKVLPYCTQVIINELQNDEIYDLLREVRSGETKISF